MKITKLAVFAAVLALAGLANANALYWMVDTSAADAVYKEAWGSAGLFVVKTGGNEYLDGLEAGAAPTLTDLGDYGSTGYSFYVELYSSAGESVYKTKAVTYDSLLSSGYISTTGVLAPSVLASAFNGASVPEPTSGVLLLVGGAMLALRRRRA